MHLSIHLLFYSGVITLYVTGNSTICQIACSSYKMPLMRMMISSPSWFVLELRSRDVPAPDNKSLGGCCRNSLPIVINPLRNISLWMFYAFRMGGCYTWLNLYMLCRIGFREGPFQCTCETFLSHTKKMHIDLAVVYVVRIDHGRLQYIFSSSVIYATSIRVTFWQFSFLRK